MAASMAIVRLQQQHLRHLMRTRPRKPAMRKRPPPTRASRMATSAISVAAARIAAISRRVSARSITASATVRTTSAVSGMSGRNAANVRSASPIPIRLSRSLPRSRRSLNRAAKSEARRIHFRLDRQRIDKWLWHARVVRTRTAAAELAGAGRVRVNGARIDAPSRAVKPGDVVTVTLDRVRVLKVLSFAERRGSASDASVLFEDMQPVLRMTRQDTEKIEAAPLTREPGAGRPTKRDRRAIDRLMKH